MKKLFILFMLLGCGSFLSAQVIHEESNFGGQSTHHKPPMQDSYGGTRHILPSEEMNNPSQVRPPPVENRDLPGHRLGDSYGATHHIRPPNSNGETNGPHTKQPMQDSRSHWLGDSSYSGGANTKPNSNDEASGERGSFTHPRY